MIREWAMQKCPKGLVQNMSKKLIAKRELTGYYMLIPATLLFLMINGFPLVYGLVLSFTNKNYTKTKSGKFIGLRNFIDIFQDSEFWGIMGFTLFYTVVVVMVSYVLGLALAMLLNRNIRGRAVFRTLALAPWVIPTVVATQCWRWILNDQFGIVNQFLMRIHLIDSPILFLSSAQLARVTVIMSGVWKTYPFMMVILLAGLQSIGTDMYEPAYMDGANSFQVFRYITLPLLRPVSMMGIALQLLWTFNSLSYDNIYLLTQGGPSQSTYVVSILSYYTAIYRGKIGYASAIATLMMVLIALLVLCYSMMKAASARAEIKRLEALAR